MQHLKDNLADAEVAKETHLPGGAKDAAHGAARLGADTEGTPLVVTHEDGFDGLAVG